MSLLKRVPRDFQRSYRARLQVWKQITLPGLLLVVAIVVVRFLGLLQPLELDSFDLLLRHRPQESPDPRIALVGITQADIRALNHYPVYDSELTTVLQNLAAAQARVIGLDIFRDLPVPPGHDELLETFEALDNLVAIELLGETEQPIIAAPPRIPPERVGFVNFKEDEDWRLRRALLTTGADDVDQAFSLRLVQAYLRPEGYRMDETSDRIAFVPVGERSGRRSVEHPQQEHHDQQRRSLSALHTLTANTGGYVRDGIKGKAALLKFRQNPQPFERLTLMEVLEGRFDPERVRDRIVLIGNIASGSKDVFLTAGFEPTLWAQLENYQGRVPFIYGLEVHAHATSQILSQILGERPDLWALPDVLEYLLIVGVGLLASGLGLLLASPLGRLLGLGVLSAGLVLLCYASLTWGLWLPLVPCLLALLGVGFTTLFVDRELRLQLEQTNATLEHAYNAVHNGPLQSLVVLLRQTESQSRLHQPLQALNRELRDIYETLRIELNRSGQQFTLGQTQLNADEPLTLLLDQTYSITVGRDFPGFESIVVFMRPQLEPLKDATLSQSQKQQVCRFLEEALCNVGKHARSAKRLDVVALRDRRWFHLQVIDDGCATDDGPENSGLENWGPEKSDNFGKTRAATQNATVTQVSMARLTSRFTNRSTAYFVTHAGNRAKTQALPRSAQPLSQGSRQMLAIAQSLGGRFERLPRHPRGTICQLSWPVTPPLLQRLRQLLRQL